MTLLYFYLQVPLLGTYSHFLKTNKNKTGHELMSRLQRRIDHSREEEVRPHVPRVEGPLSEGGRACRRG